mgnify:CR=1 FL=1
MYIINVFDQTRNLALRYTVACTITESLNHPQMDDFINNNHTLITLNKENSIQLHDSITFDENAQKITPLLNYIKIEIDD